MTTAKKTAVKKVVKSTKVKKVAHSAEGMELPTGQYTYALGRRKRAIAKVKLWLTGTGVITVNGKPSNVYFTTYDLREILTDALKVVGHDGDVTVFAETLGGGTRGQAEAIRLGISRALIKINPEFRKSLKKLGYLMRDPREKERKHYGFKRARKGSQWAKR